MTNSNPIIINFLVGPKRQAPGPSTEGRCMFCPHPRREEKKKKRKRRNIFEKELKEI